jgi:CDP-diacylglycerol--serine O-phosphatidyltransferase
MGKRLRRVDLRKSLFLLPNLITLSSIFCGFYSITVSAQAKGDSDFYRSALLIVFAMFFDTLDGRVARMTKTQSAFGLQFDSIADVVSFGAAPSMLVYNWTLHNLGLTGLVASFVFLGCGAVRLARFNVLSMGEAGQPQKPSKYIVGLPIPGAAGILVSIIVANHAASTSLGEAKYSWAAFGVTLGLSFLMVSTIRFRSFKDVKLNLRTVLLVAFAILSSVVISLRLRAEFVLVWLLGFYVLLGIFESLWQLPGRLRERMSRGDSPSTPPADPPP